MAAVLPISVGVAFGASSCLDRPLCSDCMPQTTNVFVERYQNTTVDKIDLLFMIDNSSSMKDKQDVLVAAVPDLVNRLVAPNCVPIDGMGKAVANPGYGVNCPDGTEPEFPPVQNIHIGVITSSLGDHGAGTTCPQPDASPLVAEENDDRGELVGARPRANASMTTITNLQRMTGEDPAGFLNWHPAADSNGGAVAGEGNGPAPLITTFTSMIGDVDQQGCGFEAQLESWYRFLVDPSPPFSITQGPCPNDATQKCATPTGLDMALLSQRAAFLRADSLLAVIMLSDENDCSIRDEQQAYVAAESDNVEQLPNGSDECAGNPNDPCCYNCELGPPSGVTCKPFSEEAACQPSAPRQDSVRNPNNFNLRCYKQKQRFGVDFLYPTARYVNALKDPLICPSRDDLDPTNCAPSDLEPNPIYSDLSKKGVLPRSSDLVFLAGIHGVPWQDIQATTAPDGTTYDPGELHYKTASQMVSDGTWATILGDVNQNVPALDPLMQESPSPRGGADPVAAVGDLVPPTNAPRFLTPGSNPGNGHEWADAAQDDLEYACIFKLATQRDDSSAPGTDCDGRDPTDDNPLCQNLDGTYGTTQYFAKGYPGLRELQVIKDFDKNGIVASICARDLDGGPIMNHAQDYGYRPAIDAIVDRLKEQLATKCLPRPLEVEPDGTVPCDVVEAGVGGDFQSCNLPGACVPGSSGCVSAAVLGSARAELAGEGVCSNNPTGPGVTACNSFYFCGIKPAGDACHDADSGSSVGWCYIDPANNARDDTPVGQTLVKNCSATQKRLLRFVGGTPANGSITLVACQGAAISATTYGPDGG